MYCQYFNKVILLLLFTLGVVFPQNGQIDYNALKQRYNIISEKDGVLKLQDKLTGKTIIKTENIKNIPSDCNFDLTVDLRTIDTTQYSKLFTLWGEIPPYYAGPPLIVADINSDGRKEVYGEYRNSPYGFIVIYEINSNGSYDSIYQYPDSLGAPWCIGDLENNDIPEIINSFIDYYPGGYNHYIKVLTIDSTTGYPTSIKTVYDPTTGLGQPVDMTLYDIDGDSYPEMIYRLDGSGDSLVLSNSFQITKYDRLNNEFNILYQNRPSVYSIYTRGFAFGDFDSDGKQNFAVSNEFGEVFVYEYVEGNNYNVIRIDSLPISNVYMQLFTNDINHNGKPELWICGDGYINGTGSQIIYIYEADGDDQYTIVYSIAVIGGGTWFASNMVTADIDNDGTEEVLLCIDQNLLIFNYKGSGYKLYYIKRNELLNQNSVFFSATSADFDGDDYPEIIISMDLIENNVYRGFSRIYKKSSTLDVSYNDITPYNYYLSEAFPNPFNPSTKIKYQIPQSGNVMVKVFDILGAEVTTLVNEVQNEGRYEVNFDASRLASGVYIYSLKVNDFVDSKKMILMK